MHIWGNMTWQIKMAKLIKFTVKSQPFLYYFLIIYKGSILKTLPIDFHWSTTHDCPFSVSLYLWLLFIHPLHSAAKFPQFCPWLSFFLIVHLIHKVGICNYYLTATFRSRIQSWSLSKIPILYILKYKSLYKLN